MPDTGDAHNLMAQADAQARADLPGDADTATRRMYAALLFKKMMRRHKNEDQHVKQAAIREIDAKLKSIKDRAHSAKFDKYIAEEKHKAEPHDPLAAFASRPAFQKFTKKGSAPGQEPVRVISREEADIFIMDIKGRARAKGASLPFKTLFELASKKFGLNKKNLDTPAMAHLKAALLAEQAADKQRAAEREKQKIEATPLAQDAIQAFLEELKGSPGYDPGDVLTLLDRARERFGLSAANVNLPRYGALKAVLIEQMVSQGYTSPGDAEFTLELLMG